MLAAASRHDAGVSLFDVATGERTRQWEIPSRGSSVLRFSANGKVLACTSGRRWDRDGSACAWDTKTGKELGRFSIPEDALSGVALSPDGKVLVGWGRKNGVILWDVASGKESKRIPVGAGGWFTNLTFSLGGKQLAVAEGVAVSVWDTETAKLVYRSAARRGAGALLTYSPDGKTLAAADGSSVQLWKAASGKRLELYHGLKECPLA
jgi:WD40 repeat protein